MMKKAKQRALGRAVMGKQQCSQPLTAQLFRGWRHVSAEKKSEAQAVVQKYI